MLKTLNRCISLPLATAGLLFASGCATAPDIAPENEVEPVMQKSEWLRTVQDNLTNNLCEEDQIFRTCFSITESECKDRVLEAAMGCESEYQGEIPEALSDHQGHRWGGQIGQCTGETLYDVLDANYAFNDTDSCRKFMSPM